MKVLGLDTATSGCSAALWIDGRVTARRAEPMARGQAEALVPMVEAVLADAGLRFTDLDRIAVTVGPGAFTGVRLAVALAQGIALALDRPVLPVSTLAVLAAGAPAAAGDRIVAAIDARMGEVYLGAFDRGGGEPRALMPERVVGPVDAALPEGTGWWGVGTGFDAGEGALRTRMGAALAGADAAALPRAGDVARLGALALGRGEGLAPERLEPAYLRDNVALTSREQQALRDARR